MKKLIQLEEAAMLVLGIVLFSTTDFAWWWFLLLILLPDISMIGYLQNSRVGAIIYNIFHHKGLGILLYIAGIAADWSLISLVGIILFSHASLDRMLGYGLKYSDSFSHTHLGWIGNKDIDQKMPADG